MKKMIMIVMVLTMLIGGCATSGLRFSETNIGKVPEDPEQGRVFFYRPSSFGSAIQPEVMLNNEGVGEAISWGFFYVDRPAGDYTVLIQTEVVKKCKFVLEKGHTIYIKISSGLGFIMARISPEIVDEVTALDELKSLRYIGDQEIKSKEGLK
jgi:hypothetical protein